MKRAEACARQLQAGFESHTGPTYIPDSGIHRPKGKPRTSRTINAGKPKKSRVMNGGKLLRNVIHSGNTLLLCKRQLAMALRSVRKRSVRLPPEPDKEVEVEPEDRLSDRRALNRRQSRKTSLNNQGDDKTFQVVFCMPAIKTCYGCHQPFRRKYGQEPTNIVLKVMCHRPYTNVLGRRATSWHRQAA